MHRKWRWIGHTLRRDSNNWHGKTSLELSATGKEESWTAKKQLGEVHAARVGETRLLLRESKVLAKKPCALECAGVQDDVAELT